jgi:acetylornithine/succinyldiaminopimelate/putrescine aminotransferase
MAADLRALARDHLWLHFTQMGGYEAPIIVRGSGCYLEDDAGNRYLDALAGLFAVQIGYSYGEEIAEAAAAQMRELPFYTKRHPARPDHPGEGALVRLRGDRRAPGVRRGRGDPRRRARRGLGAGHVTAGFAP